MIGRILLGLTLVGTVGGCRRASVESGAPGEPRREKGGSGSAQVTYRPETHVLEREEGIRALQGASTDGWSLLFDAKDPKLRSLKADDVLLIKGLIARKVIAAEVQDSQVLVLTRIASLGEAIQDGHIQLTAPIRFTPSPSRGASSGWPVSSAYAAEPNAVSEPVAMTKDEKGWETAFKAVQGKGRLDISLSLKKEVGGFKGAITGQGYLADFDLDSGIEVKHGLVEQLQLAHKKLNGVMNFTWQVAKETPGPATGDDRIKLPAGISIPLYQYLEGFPLFLEIGSALIIKPAISGGQEYSRGSFRITFDGYQSFLAKKGTIDATGNVTGDIALLESRNISPLAPMGMVVAFAAPRIELSFGTTKLFEQEGFKEVGKKIQQVAKAVDKLADELAKRVLGEEGYASWKSSPAGHFSEPLKNILDSDAAGYIELVTSSGMSHTGASAIVPCTRTDLHLWVKVGASAQAFGMELGKTDQEIFKKDVTRIEPPGVRLCEEAGPG
jgi:hypothetical protein